RSIPMSLSERTATRAIASAASRGTSPPRSASRENFPVLPDCGRSNGRAGGGGGGGGAEPFSWLSKMLPLSALVIGDFLPQPELRGRPSPLARRRAGELHVLRRRS